MATKAAIGEEPEIEKKVCITPVANSIQLPQKIDISVIDHETPKKNFKQKTLQILLMWLFCKNQVNPLWLTVTNKHLIRCCVVMNLNFALDLSSSQYLSSFSQKDKIVQFKQMDQGNVNFWQSVFYTKYHEDQASQTQNQQQMNHQDILQEHLIYNQYRNLILNKEQLKMNLYPIDEKIYHDYVRLDGKKGQKNRMNIFAIDCEMVQTENRLELARVSIVDYNYRVVLDILVKPQTIILDYNTKYSGITEEMLSNVTITLAEAQKMVKSILDEESILIGHSLENDLNALQMIHHKCVDTSVLYMTESNRKQSLKNLAHKYLNLSIQKDTHDSNEDAKIALSLAKLRIEILNHFSSASFPQQQTATPDVLIQLRKFGGIHLVDSRQEVELLLKYDVGFEDGEQINDEKKMKRMIELLKQRSANAVNPKLIFAQIQNKFQEFESLFLTMYNLAPSQTMFILSIGGEQQQILLITK
ncbi:unnamed protein product (macronuclear) [Paramecium tetraurelia]|uniref:Exonuclease domain-containing protein n=1 Tax=Paramecium tetraurelia TaxID=5888 RepID=A0CBQ5_PARTE|nr:uncharacterized protein GSPATT00037005001 [Paramecium tetraurelia]CAK68222.1 unnamed protein product [Paramecium tetraurelia]|eukprot:XP_001435619.1 hypothetical protein (macronuclear) [Paramecium tetraurelia strain d4-2]